MSVELELTPDILSELAAPRRPGQTVVGFAAEHGDGALDYGRDKLARKRLDAIVVNDISRAGHRLRRHAQRGDDRDRRPARPPVPRSAKRDVAAAILDEVIRLRAKDVARA